MFAFENLKNNRPIVVSAFGLSAGNYLRSFWNLILLELRKGVLFGTRLVIPNFTFVLCLSTSQVQEESYLSLFVLLHETIYEASLSCLQRFMLRKI
jgi:hypothetical protein